MGCLMEFKHYFIQKWVSQSSNFSLASKVFCRAFYFRRGRQDNLCVRLAFSHEATNKPNFNIQAIISIFDFFWKKSIFFGFLLIKVAKTASMWLFLLKPPMSPKTYLTYKKEDFDDAVAVQKLRRNTCAQNVVHWRIKS
jgi:hypothetical protein